MSVRRFLIVYLGTVVLLAVTGTAAIRAVKERHAAPTVTIAAQDSLTPALPVVAPSQQVAAAGPDFSTLPPLRPPHYAPHQAHRRPAHPVLLAARTAPQHGTPRRTALRPPTLPPEPYAAAWLPPPRPIGSYPYPPPGPGYYPGYPWPYYRPF
ncbi:MAG TPA: hypothetical protein VFL55_11445 [Acetobacteraceae bacterium]|nr:hypothetical protein [Acetobacteraceae bacterium]